MEASLIWFIGCLILSICFNILSYISLDDRLEKIEKQLKIDKE